MTQSEEISKLRAEIEELKKQLAENKNSDEKRHQEIKELQQQQHQDNLRWKKIGAAGALSTPLTFFLSFLFNFLKKERNQPDLTKIAEIIRESKK